MPQILNALLKSTGKMIIGVSFTMGKGMYRVVHIPEDETVLLNSREKKAPYLICVEVLKGETPRFRPCVTGLGVLLLRSVRHLSFGLLNKPRSGMSSTELQRRQISFGSRPRPIVRIVAPRACIRQPPLASITRLLLSPVFTWCETFMASSLAFAYALKESNTFKFLEVFLGFISTAVCFVDSILALKEKLDKAKKVGMKKVSRA